MTLSRQLTFARIPAGKGLESALARSPAEVISEVTQSGLRGRGGAGFPTGKKWSLAAAAPEETKYIVCNADEGEPGTFKDRLLLSDFADLVFEGMTIAGRAVGAREGIVYLRAEYAYLRPHLERVLATRRDRLLLGRDIAKVEGFDFDVRIQLGAGAYVCGEETALLQSLEGFRGEPRNRPPFPVEAGLFGRPTVVNNVETLAWVSCILANGAEWFRKLGSEKSPGLKLLSVSGDCERPGVYEAPFGVTVSELLAEVGGTGAKAVQIGGASGCCVPASQFHRRIAYEDVPTGGAVVVFGPHRDMLRVAHNFLEFFVDESCGQCTPCRVGTRKLLDTVEMLRDGRCSSEWLREIRSLAETMQLASRCGLGQTSPSAFLSILEHFPDELLGRSSLPASPSEVRQ